MSLRTEVRVNYRIGHSQCPLELSGSAADSDATMT